MKQSWFGALAAISLAGLSGPGSHAAEPAELSRLFPREAELFVESAGLSRLALPAEVLEACRPDLSDLRLFDRQGREIPFLTDAGRDAAGAVEVTRKYLPPILEARREEIRRQAGPPLRRESFELGMPDDVSTFEWVLIVDPGERNFAVRVRVEAIDEAGRATPLVEDGSLFRLGGGKEKLRLPLPRFADAKLRVLLESEERFWLEPGLRLENARVLESGARIATPLEPLSIRSEGERTFVELARPWGIVPDLLRIETTTPTFDREITVWDEGPTAAVEALGSGRVFRVKAVVTLGEQELVLRAARGDRLRVEIVDGDSPPLAELELFAVIRQPSLVFSADPGPSGSAAATLRFGGGRARAPRYDLSTLLPSLGRKETGARAEAAALLYDSARIPPARFAGIRDNPGYDGAPALAFAMQAGARIDSRPFRHARTLHVPASPEGLSYLTLEPADLAASSENLSDLRVADESSHQWPYLVDRRAAVERVRVEIDGPRTEDGSSRYDLRFPVAPLAPDRLLLDIDAGYVDRAFRVEMLDDSEEQAEPIRGRLIRAIGDTRDLSVDLPGRRATSLRLIVEDGDDAPLVLRSAHARVELPRLYLTVPEGRYRLLLGAPDQSAPRYELARVRDVVLAVRATAIRAEPLARNPDYSLRSRLQGSGLRQSVLLWALLVVAVIVLVTMTLRLSRR